MIFDALSTIKDTNGSDISAIVRYIEVRDYFLTCNPCITLSNMLSSKLH